MGEQADIVVLGAGMAGGCARPWRRLTRVRTCSSSRQPKPSGIYGAERWTRLGPNPHPAQGDSQCHCHENVSAS
jgi:succinate dehydrogenase/fumarate reductase flavoprotein subunit